jgi:rhodanese-related sulfurtransferase
MTSDSARIQQNRNYFAAKLQAEKQRSDVLHAVEDGGAYDFVLLDTRGREAFAHGHIPGAWSISLDDVDAAIPQLPKDKEIVTYCWGHD